MSNPTLEGASPHQATEVRCRHCQDRVLLIARHRGKALQAMAMHLVLEHTNIGTLMLEGTDLLVGLAGHRCDLCLIPAEPPWWTYTTPPAADFTPEDPEWLVCEGCHELISSESKPLRLLTERSLKTQMAEFILDGVPEPELRATIKMTIRQFLDHRQGDPVKGMS